MTNLDYFRRSYLSFFSPFLFLLVEAVFLVMGNSAYKGEGYLTVETASIWLIIIAPLVCGIVAYDTARSGASSHHSMFVSAPRRLFVNYSPFVWNAFSASLIHVAILLGMLVQGRVWEPSVGWPAIALMALVQALTITFFAAIGYAIGSSLQPSLAGGVAAIGSFLVLSIFGPVSSINVFAITGATVPQIGMTWNTPGQLVRLVLLVLGIVLLVYGNWRNRRERIKLLHPFVVIPVLIGLGAGPFLFPMDYKKDLDVRAFRNTCTVIETTGSFPPIKICMFDEHRDRLSSFASMMNGAIQKVEDSGLSLQYASTWHELAWGRQLGEDTSNPVLDDTYYFQIPWSLLIKQGGEPSEVEREDIANILAFPAGCTIDRFNEGFETSSEFSDAQTEVYGAIYRVLVKGVKELQADEIKLYEQSLVVTAAWCEGA